MRASPFHIGDGDAAELPALDRLQHLRMTQRADKSFALQGALLRVHAAGYVRGKHQFQVDGTVFGDSWKDE